jgi:DnaJ-class molecular chaperone
VSVPTRLTRRSRAPIASWPSSTTLILNPGSEDRFKEISAAYDVLGDADKRKEYDEVRRMGPAAAGFGGGGGAARQVASTSMSRTSSAGFSAARGTTPVAEPHPVLDPSAAPTSKRISTWTSLRR